MNINFNILRTLLFGLSVLFFTSCSSGGGGGGTPSNTGGGGGSSTGSFTVSGTIIGNGGDVTLSLNLIEETFSGSSFTFTNTVGNNTNYDVDFVSTPSGQICTVKNGDGIITANVTNVEVICTNPLAILRQKDAAVTGNIAVGDYNGDTFPDLAFSAITLGSHQTGTNNRITRFMYGAGDGTFPSSTDLPQISGGGGHNGGPVDLNGDAIDDYPSSDGAIFRAFLGQSNNTLNLSYSSSERIGGGLHKIDTDGDGFEDFLTGAGNDAKSDQLFFELFRGNGDGTFADPVYFADRVFDKELSDLKIQFSLNFTVDDFNGDTMEDILMMVTLFNAPGRRLALLTSNGDGTFTLPTSLSDLSSDLFIGNPAFDFRSTEIASGDFDSDGDTDIAITSNTSFIQVMTNDGSGAFTAGQRVTVGTEPTHVHVADFNNDGIDDLVSVNKTSKTIVVSFGNGDATFGDSSAAADSFVNRVC